MNSMAPNGERESYRDDSVEREENATYKQRLAVFLKLEPTAALVMLWAIKLYKLYNDEAIIQFINHLDMSSGEDLFAKCNAVCSWYEEVILNRKYFIKHLIEQQLNATERERQLILLAAGKSPLSLEILISNSSKVYRIFEIDVSQINEKKELYDMVSPEYSEKLKCITADITSSSILNILNKSENEYRHDIPSIILMEGVSYYLSKQELENIIASFQSEKKNIFIIEYLVPYRCVNQKRRFIPKQIFKIIQEYSGLNYITCYTKDELKRFFREKDGDVMASYSMVDMEFTRTATNTYFKKPSDGWVECVIGEI